MGNIFSAINGNMASKPEYTYKFAIIAERNGVPNAKWGYKARPTACDTIVCQIFKMASKNNRWRGT